MIAIGIANVGVHPHHPGRDAGGWRPSLVAAAQTSGEVASRCSRHVLPNIAPSLIVQSTVLFAIAILAEAAPSYLGLGTPAPTPSWGRMLNESKDLYAQHLYLAVWPGVAIAVAVLGFNLLGDGLRDAIDPKLRMVSG
jgi:peptide/nickel transport system permease protein